MFRGEADVNVWPSRPIEVDPFDGDHYAQDWSGALDRIQAYAGISALVKLGKDPRPQTAEKCASRVPLSDVVPPITAVGAPAHHHSHKTERTEHEW